MTYKQEELSGKNLAELRKLVRERGLMKALPMFSSHGTKAQCLGLLTGQSTELQVVTEFMQCLTELVAKNLSTQAAPEPDVEPIEVTVSDGVQLVWPGAERWANDWDGALPRWPDSDRESVRALVPRPDPQWDHAAWDASISADASDEPTTKIGFPDLAAAILGGMTPLISGPPSVGKTSAVLHFAAITNWPVVRVNCERHMPRFEFIGGTIARNGATKFIPGALPRAMKYGAILVLDEADHMMADYTSVLHPVMEQGENCSLVIREQGGRVLRPHERFRVVLTANTLGGGDQGGHHASARHQDSAFLSRIQTTFQVNWMSPGREAVLLHKRGLSAERASMLVDLATATRRAWERDELAAPIDHRHTIAIAEAAEDFGFGKALMLCCLGRLGRKDRCAIGEMVQRVFGKHVHELDNDVDEGDAEEVKPMVQVEPDNSEND